MSSDVRGRIGTDSDIINRVKFGDVIVLKPMDKNGSPLIEGMMIDRATSGVLVDQSDTTYRYLLTASYGIQPMDALYVVGDLDAVNSLIEKSIFVGTMDDRRKESNV